MNKRKYFNRDLSWLGFNYRVLLEASDTTVPLFQRIKFIAIYSSNLDEFFRVRVATWRRISELKKKKLKPEMEVNPKKLLTKILREVDRQQKEYGRILSRQILPELKQAGIVIYQGNRILKSHRSTINRYFLSRILSYLQPVLLTDSNNSAPFLENGALYFVIKLQRSDDRQQEHYALLNIPSADLPRFLRLPEVRGKQYIIYLDDMIRWNLYYVFPRYQVQGCYAVKMNRDADIEIEDEYSGDLVQKIKNQIEKRKVGAPTRFLYDGAMPKDMLTYLKQRYQLADEDMITGARYHNLNDFMQLPNPVAPKLEELPMPALLNSNLDGEESILDSMLNKDLILHFPYESYDYVLRFFNEAAIDPNVTEIKVTLYRVAPNSMIVNALISAAKNGKNVTAFVEVKARFDEANNLKWAKKMEEAGVKLIYSIPGLKVHAKVALVLKKLQNREQAFAYFSTGNFHEGTARIYCDHGLLTTNIKLSEELKQVFNFLETQLVSKPFEHLLVAQHNMQDRLLALIDREMDNHSKGLPAGLVIKLNNIEEQRMINKLYEASQAGLKITLIVRGICCVIPGESFSANIKVIRLVDRFLEHARVFVFQNGGEEEVYLASADWMNRNLHRRIEVGFPILDTNIKEEILKLIDFQVVDNIKACKLNSQQDHLPNNQRKRKVRAQTDFYRWLKKKRESQTGKITK